MTYILIILTSLFGCLGAISALLLGVSFTRGQREKYPILKKLDGKQLHLLSATIVFWAIAYGANTYKEILGVKPPMETVQGPGGGFTQKATITGFKRELKEAAAELAREAEDYFNAAERDFEARRYPDAASKYRKSIDVLSTMSGYLNLGVSLYYISDFRQAEQAFTPGLQMARKKGNRGFEATFLNNIGIVYDQQGKLKEALKSYQAALELFKEIGHPLGQAGALGNIGNVYAEQGKKHEALEWLRQARAIYLKIGAKTTGLQTVEEMIDRLTVTMDKPK